MIMPRLRHENISSVSHRSLVYRVQTQDPHVKLDFGCFTCGRQTGYFILTIKYFLSHNKGGNAVTEVSLWNQSYFIKKRRSKRNKRRKEKRTTRRRLEDNWCHYIIFSFESEAPPQFNCPAPINASQWSTDSLMTLLCLRLHYLYPLSRGLTVDLGRLKVIIVWREDGVCIQ